MAPFKDKIILCAILCLAFAKVSALSTKEKRVNGGNAVQVKEDLRQIKEAFIDTDPEIVNENNPETVEENKDAIEERLRQALRKANEYNVNRIITKLHHLENKMRRRPQLYLKYRRVYLAVLRRHLLPSQEKIDMIDLMVEQLPRRQLDEREFGDESVIAQMKKDIKETKEEVKTLAATVAELLELRLK